MNVSVNQGMLNSISKRCRRLQTAASLSHARCRVAEGEAKDSRRYYVAPTKPSDKYQ